MCHVYGATIDGDRFFLKRKELLKENSKIILAEKKCPAQVYRRYTCYGCIHCLLKQCGSWVFDTKLVGMNCHIEQRNTRTTMA
jgi:hypothetical protein